MSRAPFWITTVATLALAACISQKAEIDELPEPATPTPTDEERGALHQATPDAVSGLAALTESDSEPSPEPPAEVVRADPPRTKPEMKSAREDVAVGSRGAGIAHSGPPSVAYRPASPVMPPPPPPIARDTEHYTDYGVNGFVTVAEDPLSTFAVDVDTASYAMTRRKLTEGYLPPTSGVRVEEFVNYFPYEYRQPETGHPFAVDFEATPSPWNPRNHLVRVGVQGRKVAFDQRKPVHLTFLVDVSGSMQAADKIDLLKKSFKMLTEELEDGDTVAIATYAGNTSIVLEPTPMSQKQTIMRSLDLLTAGGSTAMGAGIELAYGLADRTYVDGDVNRVIVASDGDANVGQTSHEALSKYIRGYAEKGITLTTLGFGAGNYKDTMMEQLANDGDGNYFYIDSESEARRVLVDKMTSTLEVIAKDVKIQVDWNPESVLSYRLIGYENRDVADVDFRNDKVDAGEIGAGHQVTALYEVSIRPGTKASLATVRLRNKAPGPDSPAVERSYTMPASALKGAFEEGSEHFRIAVAAGTFAEILRGSPYVGEVSLRDVQAVAKRAMRPEYREDAELVDLIGRAASLRGEGGVVVR